jgi:hypothetical protein
MLATNIAKMILAKIYNNSTEPILVKMRAPVPLAKLKMGSGGVGYTVLDNLAVATLEAFILFKGAFVNVYFPTDATVVVAFVGNASEIFIVFGGVKLHGITFY